MGNRDTIIKLVKFIFGALVSFFIIDAGIIITNLVISSVVFCISVIVLILAGMVVLRCHDSIINDCFERFLESTYLHIRNFHSGCVKQSRDDTNLCSKHRYHCCANNLINSDMYKYVLNEIEMQPDKLAIYNLISADDFDKIEANYFNEHPKGEIWVISNALETEIELPDENKNSCDMSLRQSMDVVKKNIKKGGKYVQFVSLGIQGENDIDFLKRRTEYWSAKPELTDDSECKKQMPVIPIDSNVIEVNERYFGMNTDWAFMVRLTSTVIFIDKKGLDYKGYFCFRPEEGSGAEKYEKRTILFKMPSYCMLEVIINDLEKLKKSYLERL